MHDCKLRVDGISKYLDSVGFRFDHAFGEDETNQLVRSGDGVQGGAGRGRHRGKQKGGRILRTR